MSTSTLNKLDGTTEWKKCKIDLSQPHPQPDPLLIQTDSEMAMLRKRNISTIAASAKVGKTYLISAIAAAALADEGYLGFHCPQRGVKVLLVDTEMDISDTQEVTERIHHLLHWDTTQNAPQLTAINLRGLDKLECIGVVETAISDLRPELVLLDGIVDLCDSFNEIVPSQAIVTRLTQWATMYNCHIMTCLHVNKGTDELRGHLGAFLRQKGELTLLLTKKHEEIPYVKVKPIDSRKQTIDEFAFTINNEALPELYHPTSKPPHSAKLDKLFTEILPLPNSMSYADLRTKVMETCNVKQSMAEKKIKQASINEIIEKNVVGFYQLQAKKANSKPLVD